MPAPPWSSPYIRADKRYDKTRQKKKYKTKDKPRQSIRQDKVQDKVQYKVQYKVQDKTIPSVCHTSKEVEEKVGERESMTTVREEKVKEKV